MKMEIDLETMLDIALGGPEIGPLNLHVLHALMREVFQKINLSKQNITVDQENSDFSESYNFIQSKVNKIPRTAGGGKGRLKSRVSVIVSDYVRVPIGEHCEDLRMASPSPALIEDRLRYIESELKNVKDFPTAQELRKWAKEKSTPDTVVTDLWQFVSLNHRMNGAEEGIQKLTALVDKLIPELKSLSDEQNLTSGRIDDLYSQFKGLSDRMTYIDGKVDNASKTIGEQLQTVLDSVEDAEKNLMKHPNFSDLENFVTMGLYGQAQDIARNAVDQIREDLSNKLDTSALDTVATHDDLKDVANVLNDINDKLNSCVQTGELDNFVRNEVFVDAQENASKAANVLRDDVARKANTSVVDHLAKQADLDKFTHIMDKVDQLAEQQERFCNELKSTDEQLGKKADNADILGMATENDLKKSLDKMQKNGNTLYEIQCWQKAFDNEVHEGIPQLRSKLNEIDVRISTLEGKETDGRNEGEQTDAVHLNNTLKELLEQFNDHDRSCKDITSQIHSELAQKLNRDEIQPLKDYLENCYNTLARQDHELKSADEPTVNKCKFNMQHRVPNEDWNEQLNGTSNKQQQHAPSTNKAKNIVRPNADSPKVSNGSLQHAHEINHASTPYKSKSSVSQNSPSSLLPQISQSNAPKKTSSYSNSPDELGCGHTQYYDSGGFVPYRTDGAIVRAQMKFNCLTCGRPLSMQTNTHLHTTRGRPLTAYELDQHRLLQGMLKPDGDHNEKRACGGKHTTAIPTKGADKTNTSKSLPAVGNQKGMPADGEVDIEGLDGKLYRGLISKNNATNHNRSKSVNLHLRSVSPAYGSAKDRPFT